MLTNFIMNYGIKTYMTYMFKINNYNSSILNKRY